MLAEFTNPVIIVGSSSGITPVSAEIVAQIVAEAERKLKLGQTPTPIESQTQVRPYEVSQAYICNQIDCFTKQTNLCIKFNYGDILGIS